MSSRIPIRPVQNRSKLAIVIALAIGLTAIYWIPFHVPFKDDLSTSYLFGFNNRVAMVLFVFFALGFAIWARGLGFTLPDFTNQRSPSFRRTGAFALAGSSLAAASVWFFSLHVVVFAEAQYFLDRYQMFRIAGHDYRSVNFIYGPLMFYLPVWIAALFHLSLGSSYYLGMIFEWAVGTWVLWKMVQVAARGTTYGRPIFLFVWFTSVLGIFASGEQYTPLRYCATPLFALGVHHLYTRQASMLATFGLASLGAILMLLYSPEQGIMLIAGTLLFFLFCVSVRRPGTLFGLAGFVATVAFACWFAFRQGWLDSLLAFGAGATNLPLIPSFQNATLLLLLVMAACILVASLRNRASNHPLIYLLCVALFGLPAAFSRADNGHIFYNILGAFIATFVVLNQYPVGRRWLRISLIIYLLLISRSTFGLYRDLVRHEVLLEAFDSQYHSPTAEKLVRAVAHAGYGKNAEQRIEFLRAPFVPKPQLDAPPLLSSTIFFAPWGVPRRIEPFPGDPKIVSSRFAFVHVATDQQEIDELEAHASLPLLLPFNVPAVCKPDVGYIRQYTKEVLFVPYMPHLRHLPVEHPPFCAYLNAHYAPANYLAPVPGYYVWVRSER